LHPGASCYGDLSQLILATSALLQNKLPNERGMIEMDKALMLDNWNDLVLGIGRLVGLLEGERIFDKERLPTNAALSVIAALSSIIPETGDARGQAETLLRKFLWSAFFTDRYENSAPTRAFADYKGLRNLIADEKTDGAKSFREDDVPVLNRQEFP